MATKRVKKSEMSEMSVGEPEMAAAVVNDRKNGAKGKWIAAVVIVVALIGFWMYKSGNWPVVAMVGMRPITRYEVDQELFKQGGKAEVENLVTMRIVQNELKSKGITITDSELNQRLDTVKQNIGPGQDLNTLLASQGMTLDDLKTQLKLQMGVEKAVADQVSVTDAEVTSYLKDNAATLTATTEAGKKDEATTNIRQQKLQTAITNWVQGLTAKAKVWRAPGL